MEEIISNYPIEEEIYKGKNCLVYKTTYKKKKYAVKQLIINNEQEKEAFEEEIKRMEEFKCENCVEYIAKEQIGDRYNLVMELCDTDLNKMLKERKKPMDADEIRKILIQLNKVFQKIQESKNNNRYDIDLKLSNIAVKYGEEGDKNNYKVKLSGFGLGKKLKISTIGPTNAPELLNQDPKTNINSKANLWSLGIIIYQLLYNELSFKGQDNSKIYQRFIQKLKDKENSKGSLKELQELLSKILVIEPEKRIDWNDYFSDYLFKKYRKIKTLGKGGFGKVYLVEDRGTKKQYAMKNLEKRVKKEDVDNEIKIMKELKCNNTVEFIEMIDENEDKEYHIILELCDTDLKEFIKERKKLETWEIIKIFKQLNNAFKIMVNKRIMHRDLKAGNIMVKYLSDDRKQYEVKLADFGLSKNLPNDKSILQSNAGTPITMAPEVLQNQSYDRKADLWSVGIILYNLTFNVYPFKGKDRKEVLNNILKMKDKIPKIEELQSDSPDLRLIKSLIKKILKINLIERISWDAYFANELFKNEIIKKDCKVIKCFDLGFPFYRSSVCIADNGKRTIIVKEFSDSFIREYSKEYSDEKAKFIKYNEKKNVIHLIEDQDESYFRYLFFELPGVKEQPKNDNKEEEQKNETTIKNVKVELLRKYIQNPRNRNLTEEDIKKINMQVLDTLFLENQNATDTSNEISFFSLDSFLIDIETKDIYLFDFGFIKCALKYKKKKELIDSYYLPDFPITENTKKLNVMNYALTLIKAYFKEDLTDYFFEKDDDLSPFFEDKEISEEFKNFLIKCLKRKEEERYSWDDCRKDPFYTIEKTKYEKPTNIISINKNVSQTNTEKNVESNQ